MTSTGRSNNDVIAETVAAIGPFKAWMGNKRAEIQGQIAQMQAAAATATPTSDSSLASRFRQLGLPQRNGGAGSAPLPAAPEDSAGVDTTVTATGDTQSTHATTSEGVAETADAAHVALPEEPVSVPSTPAAEDATTTTAALPPLQSVAEAQVYLETVFAATPPQTLPPRVISAWEGRTADARYNARMLIGAKEAGVLSAGLTHAVSGMIAFDSEFATVYQLYEGGYKELFDIGLGGSGPTDDEADDGDEDAAEGEADDDADEGEEEERQWGFPGEDSRESPF